MATEQSFAAVDTFDAAFGKTYFPFFGGGAQVVIHDRFFVGGQRVALPARPASAPSSAAGKPFKLGIPLTATITPFEVTGGYRFRLRQLPRVRAVCRPPASGRTAIRRRLSLPRPARTSTRGTPASW